MAAVAHPLVANLYNPHEQSREQLIEGFVVRHKILEQLFQEIKTSTMQFPEQHYLIEGQRGMGKTTLLLRLGYQIENDDELNTWLIPIVLKEEAYYGVHRLFQLWKEVAQALEAKDSIFSGLLEQMRAGEDDEDDYEQHCFQVLVNVLETHSKKIILFIDNLGEMFQNFDDVESHRLREILMTCSHLRIIGAASIVLEASFKYEHAFYEFFKTKQLEGLGREETWDLLLQLAKTYDDEATIQDLLKSHPGRVEALRLLTGGFIRTIILLFEIFVDDKDGDSLSDLDNVLDRVTPLYKHRMDDLAKEQRPVVNAIALNWDAISLQEIAKKTRLKIDQVTTILGELEKFFIVQRATTVVDTDLYYLKERFFNIWYLMRLSPRGSQSRVIWLVRFLENWYDQDELVARAKRHTQAIRRGDYAPKAAYYLTEALSRTGKLGIDVEHQMKVKTKELLERKDQLLATDLSPSDKDLFDQGVGYYKEENYENALTFLSQVKNKNRNAFFYLAFIHNKLEDYEKAEQYYLQAIDAGDTAPLYNLGVLYHNNLKDYEKAEQHYLQAVKAEDTRALFGLGSLYHYDLKDYPKAEQYYLQAINAGDTDTLHYLGSLYHYDLKDYPKAEQYYLQAINAGDTRTLHYLGSLYHYDLKDYPKAEQYYLQAINAGDTRDFENLGLLYLVEFQDYQQAESYFLKAIEAGEKETLNHLAWMYFEQKSKPQQAMKYAVEAIKTRRDSLSLHTLACIYVWNNRLEKAVEIAREFMSDEEFLEQEEGYLTQFCMLLLAKKQYQAVEQYFETSKINLKERLKPVHYALLHLTGDKDYARLPPEISETVQDILKEIEQLAIDYQ